MRLFFLLESSALSVKMCDKNISTVGWYVASQYLDSHRFGSSKTIQSQMVISKECARFRHVDLLSRV
jgi:hypothetical protein